MRTLAFTALLAVALGPVAPAHATTEPLPTGTGCGFRSVSLDAVDPGRWRGFMDSAPVAAASVDALGNPVAITLTCTLHVYGTAPDPAIEASASGTAVAVVAPTTVTYTAAEWDTVAVCSTARITDANGEMSTWYLSDDNDMWYPYDVGCDGAKCLVLGSDCDYTLALVAWVVDHVAPLLDEAGPIYPDVVDATVCPLLASRSPGVPGVVDIDPTGDTYVAGQFVWDCPPYIPPLSTP
jgi:hypothetical protein